MLLWSSWFDQFDWLIIKHYFYWYKWASREYFLPSLLQSSSLKFNNNNIMELLCNFSLCSTLWPFGITVKFVHKLFSCDLSPIPCELDLVMYLIIRSSVIKTQEQFTSSLYDFSLYFKAFMHKEDTLSYITSSHIIRHKNQLLRQTIWTWASHCFGYSSKKSWAPLAKSPVLLILEVKRIKLCTAQSLYI